MSKDDEFSKAISKLHKEHIVRQLKGLMSGIFLVILIFLFCRLCFWMILILSDLIEKI